jgi:hypothetical protein
VERNNGEKQKSFFNYFAAGKKQNRGLWPQFRHNTLRIQRNHSNQLTLQVDLSESHARHSRFEWACPFQEIWTCPRLPLHVSWLYQVPRPWTWKGTQAWECRCRWSR